MPTIQLGYGRGAIPFEFEGGRFDLLEPEAHDEHPLTDAEMGALIDDPIDSQPLEEIISPGESVLVVVSDATRATGSAQVVNLLVRRLVALGVAPYDLRVIFATGLHRAVTSEEKAELLTPFIVQRVRTLTHDADESKHALFGATERGTPVELNRALFEHSHVILTGSVGFHYFAGFTGGRKSVCPGLASRRTIEATHLQALDFERGGRRRAGVGAGRLDGNAVHEECERIAAEAAPSFLINTVTDERGRVVRLYAGDWRAAHRLACAEYADSHALKIKERRALVVVSAGGVPYDLNLIQAHKALEMASYACEDGGHIILVAECAEGLGRSDFLKWFDAPDAHALATRLRDAYEVNGQTAWTLLTKAERFRVHLVSNLPDDEVRLMRMNPARSIEEALARTEQSAEGYILPRGAAFMPVIAG
ncbi:MAG: lactate racemase [Acidobacteriota bacterium]|jgi:nickel-dependent lactate racemase|nr:lactate racemase [Acidobacteriota bacterium]